MSKDNASHNADDLNKTCGPCAQETEVSPSADMALKGSRLFSFWELVIIILVLGILVAILLPAFNCRPGRRSQCTNNLKNISLALLNYESQYGQFPPAYTVDEYGRPMHSWRVLILPYLDMKDTYEEFKLDEPWNSPHNLALAKKHFPDVFRCPMDGQSDKTATSYVMIVGPGCVSEGTTSVGVKAIYGTKDTILVAEVANSNTPWYEPRDLKATTMSYKINDPKKPSISSNHREGAQVAMADGSARFLHDEIKPEIIKKLTLRDVVPSNEEQAEMMGE